MRIAMVHSTFATLGGAERYVRDLAEDLVTRGHEVRIYARPSANAEPADRPVGPRLSARVPVARKVMTHLGDLVDPTGLRDHDLHGFRPDVVHLHNWQGLGVRPVARLARIYPTVHTVHDYALADPNNTLANVGRSPLGDRLLARRAAWLVHQLRGVTLLWPAERTREIVRRHVPGVAALDGRVVPLAVRSRPGAAALDRPGDRRVLLFMGALSPHKGIDVLLDAWPAVHGGTLLIAGDGPGRPAVEDAARHDPSIEYLGYVDEPGKIAALRRAGWLVLPSQWPENFPISCVEALVAGRPIVTAEIARPPMASDSSLITFAGRADLAGAVNAAISRPDYAALAASAAADGARLDWDEHVSAVLRAYQHTRRSAPSLA
jgi:glycosyltransferase involved in cell wall biosynthesis